MLTVSDPTEHAALTLTLVGNYSNSTFNVTSDGSGGVYIVDPSVMTDTIAAGGTLDISAPSDDTVTFTGGTGSLILSQPESFTGQIVGFTGTAPDASHSDTIDLIGINYDLSQFAESYNSTTGLLTLTDGTNTVSLTFDDFNATLDFASDGNGGTLVTDPPATNLSGPTAGTPFDWGMRFDSDKIDFDFDQSANQGAKAAVPDLPKSPLVSPHEDHFIFHENHAETSADPHVDAHVPANHPETVLAQQLAALVTSDPLHQAFVDLLHNDNPGAPTVSPAQWHEQLANAFHLH